MTGRWRIHLLIALIAFLAMAAGSLPAGYPPRSWPAPLTAIPALAIAGLVLPSRHGFGARSGSGLLEQKRGGSREAAGTCIAPHL